MFKSSCFQNYYSNCLAESYINKRNLCNTLVKTTLALVQVFFFIFPFYSPCSPSNIFVLVSSAVCSPSQYSIYSVRQVKSMVSLIDTFDAETSSSVVSTVVAYSSAVSSICKILHSLYLLLTPLWPLSWLLWLG